MDKSKCACTFKVVARTMFGLPMIVFGVLHFMNSAGMAGLVPSYLPGATFWVFATGLLLILGGVSIIANRYTNWLAGALALMLLSFALLIHLPLVLAGDQMAMPSLLKDFALSGAALYFASVYCAKKCA